MPWPPAPRVVALHLQHPGGRKARQLATVGMSLILEAHRDGRYGGSPQHEEAQLGRVLADKQRYSLLLFYSSHCKLCQALQPVVEEVETNERHRLSVARLNTDHEVQWAPEMLHYQVDTVPCFILLAPDGSALCRTTAPRSLDHMTRCLQQMVDL
uniref:Thioredoxin domain-containing protein n=1 Tax=Tetraselmis chuii TaxID=63592 RepID=A0A7S1SU75_9CHLO|mmetsp:Transcript_29661/g.53127  ORF Transcript_29661/g.53127 Transcript_29661/m.53127 type:complete len:155 (+) Transcript_29661:262-726(+)